MLNFFPRWINKVTNISKQKTIWSDQKPSRSAKCKCHLQQNSGKHCLQVLVSYLRGSGSGAGQVHHSRWKKIHHVGRSVEVHKNFSVLMAITRKSHTTKQQSWIIKKKKKKPTHRVSLLFYSHLIFVLAFSKFIITVTCANLRFSHNISIYTSNWKGFSKEKSFQLHLQFWPRWPGTSMTIRFI